MSLRYYQESIFLLLLVFLLAVVSLQWAESFVSPSHPLPVHRDQDASQVPSAQEDGGPSLVSR